MSSDFLLTVLRVGLFLAVATVGCSARLPVGPDWVPLVLLRHHQGNALAGAGRARGHNSPPRQGRREYAVRYLGSDPGREMDRALGRRT